MLSGGADQQPYGFPWLLLVCPWGADPAFGEVDEGTDIEPRTLEGGAEPGGAGGARVDVSPSKMR